MKKNEGKVLAKIIDGKKIAQKTIEAAQKKIEELKQKGIPVGLAIVQIGENEASSIYIQKKLKTAQEIGITTKFLKLAQNTDFRMLMHKIEELNNDKEVSGIIIQMPIPKHLNLLDVLSLVEAQKDVDGFNPQNQGRLFAGEPYFAPATAKGIIKLIESTGQKITGKTAVVVGRSIIVGKPTAMLLSNNNATVTIAHSMTKNLAQTTKQADIVVVAVGKAKLIKKNMVKKGAIVIDVGISRLKGKIVGDVDFENVKKVAGCITPVPGGVGPMTVACLIENTVLAAQRQAHEKTA